MLLACKSAFCCALVATEVKRQKKAKTDNFIMSLILSVKIVDGAKVEGDGDTKKKKKRCLSDYFYVAILCYWLPTTFDDAKMRHKMVMFGVKKVGIIVFRQKKRHKTDKFCANCMWLGFV